MPKLLYVDDEESSRTLIAEELEDNDYLVITKDSGHGLLNLIKQEIPDLILLDIKMAEHDGLDLLQDIREQFGYKIPVILYTAYGHYMDDIKSVAADYYVIKSYDLTELKQRISMALEAYNKPLPPKLCKTKVFGLIEEHLLSFINNNYAQQRPLSKSDPGYDQLLSMFRQKEYFRYFSEDEVESLFTATRERFLGDVRRVRKKMKELILALGFLDEHHTMDRLHEEISPLLSALSRENFELVVRKVLEDFTKESKFLSKLLAEIKEQIERRDYSGVQVENLKAALIFSRSSIALEHLNVGDVIMSEIRHDMRAKLRKLRIYLDKLREGIEADPRDKARQLIRQFQQESGNQVCFGTNRVETCREEACLWRPDCMENIDGWIGSDILDKIFKTYSELLSINDRLCDITSLTVVPHFKLIDVKRFLEVTLKSLGLLHAKNIKVELHCEDGIGAMTDTNLLGVVMRQVLENASEAIGPRGCDGFINLSVELSGSCKELRFIVEDNGYGIPKDLLDKVFEPKVRYKKEGHSGMGLSLARLAASSIGGSIRIDSELGLGTTVFLTIPWEA